MPAIFKYLSRKWLDALLGQGRIRIGTLDEYRHGPYPREVADRHEGHREVVLPPAVAAEDRELLAQIEPVLENSPASHELRIRQVPLHDDEARVVVEAKTPNLFLFSASRRCDDDLRRRLGRDACVRIDDADRFFDLLSGRLGDRARFLGWREVVYEDPRHPEPREPGLSPAFFKRVEFSHQKEVRALWEPHAQPIEPIVVECREVAALCSVVDGLQPEAP